MARSKSPKTNGNTQAPTTSTESMLSNSVESPAQSTATSGLATGVARAKNKNNRKPEIVKADSRSSLVPINLDDEIRSLAYLLSERRGFEPGHETEDWLNAEREVLGRYEQQRA
jgi:DUF2934 family protein